MEVFGTGDGRCLGLEGGREGTDGGLVSDANGVSCMDGGDGWLAG